MNTAPLPLRPERASAPRLRRRLWLGGFGMALFLATLAAGTHVANPRASLVSGMRGDDLVPSYMAGAFVRAGRADLLMDLPAARQFQAQLRRDAGLEQHGRTGPWLNPPFYALLFVPLAALPYKTALLAWLALNLVLLAAAVVLLCRMLPPRAGPAGGWRTWGLVPLLIACSMPFVQAMACQQNTFLSLLLLSATVACWRAGRGLAAGLVAGLLLFKPQLAAVVAAVLVCTLGRRAAIGVLTTGLALLLLTVIAMPGALADYVHKLPALLPWLEPGRVYHWERQVTFQGFWRLLLQGPVSGPAPAAARWLWPAAALPVGCALAALVGRHLRDRAGRRSRDRLIAAALVAMPLLMPYYMDYDLLLLAVPAALFAAEVVGRGGGPLDRLDRWTVGAWFVLFPWLYLNAAVGFDSRVSLTVPLLTVLSGLTTARAWRADAVATGRDDQADDVRPAPIARAA